MITLLIILAVLAVAFAALVSRQPTTFHIERAIRIAAPAARIFPHVDASRGWEAWSPWSQIDPQARFSYEGPPAGVGAITRFAGKRAGTGTCTVVASRRDELIRFRLDMVKPFKGSSDAAFTFIADGDGTIVTWSLSGSCPLPARIARVFMNCDEMCGRCFSQGLENLKRLVETGSKAAPEPLATAC